MHARPLLSGRPAVAASVSPSVALFNAVQMLSGQDELGEVRDLGCRVVVFLRSSDIDAQETGEDPAKLIQRSLEAEISFLGDNITQQESGPSSKFVLGSIVNKSSSIYITVQVLISISLTLLFKYCGLCHPNCIVVVFEDVREAQQTAHTYAEKYVRLRQEYEVCN